MSTLKYPNKEPVVPQEGNMKAAWFIVALPLLRKLHVEPLVTMMLIVKDIPFVMPTEECFVELPLPFLNVPTIGISFRVIMDNY